MFGRALTLRVFAGVCASFGVHKSFSFPEESKAERLKAADVPRPETFFLEVYATNCHSCKMVDHVMSQVQAALSAVGSDVKVYRMEVEDYRASAFWPDKAKPINVPIILLHSNKGSLERYSGPFQGAELLRWLHKRRPLQLDQSLAVAAQRQGDTIDSIYSQARKKVQESHELYPVLMWRSPCGEDFLWAHVQQLGFLPSEEPRMPQLTRCMSRLEYRDFWHKVLTVSKTARKDSFPV